MLLEVILWEGRWKITKQGCSPRMVVLQSVVAVLFCIFFDCLSQDMELSSVLKQPWQLRSRKHSSSGKLPDGDKNQFILTLDDLVSLMQCDETVSS